jgi:hypothetical protein
VKFRWCAFVLALLLTATPVLGMVCQMDCDQPPATSACHKSAASPEGPAVRNAGHPCGHDHTSGKPAVLTTSNARDCAVTIVALTATIVGHTSSADARLPAASMHGPPGLSGRTTVSRIPVLRI